VQVQEGMPTGSNAPATSFPPNNTPPYARAFSAAHTYPRSPSPGGEPRACAFCLSWCSSATDWDSVVVNECPRGRVMHSKCRTTRREGSVNAYAQKIHLPDFFSYASRAMPFSRGSRYARPPVRLPAAPTREAVAVSRSDVATPPRRQTPIPRAHVVAVLPRLQPPVTSPRHHTFTRYVIFARARRRERKRRRAITGRHTGNGRHVMQVEDTLQPPLTVQTKTEEAGRRPPSHLELATEVMPRAYDTAG
jgi:hypothetical protein